MTNPLPQANHYILFSISSKTAPDALVIRKEIETSLSTSFGLTASNIHVDVLWVSETGDKAVIRTAPHDAAKVMAAVAISNSTTTMSVLKESPFLPSLLGDTSTLPF